MVIKNQQVTQVLRNINDAGISRIKGKLQSKLEVDNSPGRIGEAKDLLGLEPNIETCPLYC